MKAILTELGLLCALGNSQDEVSSGLLEGRSEGMLAGEEFSPGRRLVYGSVRGDLSPLPSQEAAWGGRNNQLLWSAVQQIRPALDAAIRLYGATRIAVVLGTSTSSIGAAESAFASRNPDASFPSSFHYAQMEIGTPSQFLAYFLGLQGPQLTISTACSSSAKALAAARRYLKLGLCDAVLCGGSDMLCRFTVAGFSALEAVSPELCLPFSAKRKGINLGEGAALFLMEREGEGVELSGCGESCDAHHISAPEPEGRGAAAAMRAALEDASLGADAIDYLNLHGTATLHNDAMESLAVARVLGRQNAMQLDQAFKWPYPRRRWRSGSGLLLAAFETKEPEPAATSL